MVEDTIVGSTVENRQDAWTPKEVVRVAGGDGADGVEAVEVGRRNFEFESGEVVLDLAGSACSENRNDVVALADPVESYLRGWAGKRAGNFKNSLENGEVAIVEIDKLGDVGEAAVARAVAGVAPGEEASGEGRPGGNADVESAAHGDDITLGGALQQGVFDLGADEGCPPVKLGERVGAGNDPSGKVGEANVEDLSGTNEIVERTHHFIDWRKCIESMDPVEIQVIGVETLEAGFKGADEVLAMVAASVGIAG